MSDVTLQVSQATFSDVLKTLWPLSVPITGGGSQGGLSGFIDAKFHISSIEEVEFNDASTFTATNIEINWDTLIFQVGIDIPPVKIGQFCLAHVPGFLQGFFGGDSCLVMFPGVTLFTAVPDVYITLNLSPIFQYIITQATVIGKIDVNYTTKTPPDSNYWGLYVDPSAVHVEPIDIENTLGQSTILLLAAIDVAVNYIVSIAPEAFMIDALLGVLGFPTISEWILDILGIQDSVEQWLTKWLNVSIGIDQLIYEVLLKAILANAPFKIDDPVKLISAVTPADPTKYGGFGPTGTDGSTTKAVTLAAVTLGVLQPAVTFTGGEIVVTFDFAS